MSKQDVAVMEESLRSKYGIPHLMAEDEDEQLALDLD